VKVSGLEVFELVALCLAVSLVPLAVFDVRKRAVPVLPLVLVSLAGVAMNTAFAVRYSLTPIQLQQLLMSLSFLALCILMAFAKWVGGGDALVYTAAFCIDPFNRLHTAEYNPLAVVLHIAGYSPLTVVPPFPCILALSLGLALYIHRILYNRREAPLAVYIVASLCIVRSILTAAALI